MTDKNDHPNQTDSPDEFELIETLAKPFLRYEKRQLLVPNGDDAAVYLPAAGLGQVVCVDTLVEDIHFKRVTMEPQHIGIKSLAVNLSDMAAMGATPLSFLVSVAIPPQWSQKELEHIYGGMKTLADQYELDLLGGDTVSSPKHLMLSVTLLGEVDSRVKLLRSNAKPGDIVFVTGKVGDSAGGLHLLLRSPAYKSDLRFTELIDAHQQPKPHITQGNILAQLGKHHRIALNDISDGLVSEAIEIAQSSGVNIILEREKLPISLALRRYAQLVQQDFLHWAMYGGEDFVLIGTATPDAYQEIEHRFQVEKRELYPIGVVMAGKGEVYLKHDETCTRLQKKGYNHFRSFG